MIDRRGLLAAGLAMPLAAASVAGAPTPLRVTSDRIFVPAVVNGVAVEALLDSAAETSIVDAAFAVRLRLSGEEAVTARGTGAATAVATMVRGVAIDVAGLRLRPAEVAIIDLADIARRLANGPIPLVLGRELFDAARLAIDIDDGAIAVAPPTLPAGVRLPLTARRGIETVPLAIEGRPAQADFDLGNGGTVLVGAAYARRHRLLDGRPTGVVAGGGIGGETRQMTFMLASLEIAGRRFENVPAAIDTSPTASDANVGVRVLRNFGIVTDFAARSIWLA
ncbi:MAG: retropepsin-like domain-containing protein [Sphingomonadaceae bacterium]|nr:retropepsin-like domain-containing protein [Sphingomonadaceae bacterium]